MSLLPSEPDTSAAAENDPRVVDLNSDDADDVLSALTSDTARELLSELHDTPAPPADLAERADTSLQNAQYHLNKLEDAGAIEVIDTIYSEKGREMNVYAPADRPLVIFAGDEEEASGIRAALSRLLGSLGILGLASLAIQEAFGESLLGFLGNSGTSDRGAAPGPAPADDNGTTTSAPDRGDDADYQAEEAGESDGSAAGDDSISGGDGGDGGGINAADAESTTTPDGGTPIEEDAAKPTETEAPEMSERAADGADGADVLAQTGNETASNATDVATTTVANATDAAGSGAPDAATAALSLPPGLVFFLGGMTALAVVAGIWYVGR